MYFFYMLCSSLLDFFFCARFVVSLPYLQFNRYYMISKKHVFVVICVVCTTSIMASGRSTRNLNKGWFFMRGDIPAAETIDFNDSIWESVTIPHDWAIYGPFDKEIDIQRVAIVQNGEQEPTEKTGRTGALPYIGVGWYRLHFSVPENEPSKRIVLMFDGAMSEPKVYLNGQFVGQWAYGYNSFYFDITSFVNGQDDNVLAIRLENHPESSRWYSGAGLYRNVHLIVTNKTAVDVWGTTITTPVVSKDFAKVNVKVNVASAVGKNLTIHRRIVDMQGREVAFSQSTDIHFYDNENISELVVASPELWSPEHPTLYNMQIKVYEQDQLLDSCETRFGIRDIHYDSNQGFMLNGEVRKFKGVCLHHDLGPLGAAVNEAAIRRQLRILKEMGCDAIRSSHNMPSPEQVALCEEMGLMLMAESFDEWKLPKCKNGYNRFFDEWVEQDIVNLVRHYRNSPAIVMWSSGNEVPDQWGSDGVKRALRLQQIFHREDPTRPVTVGMDQVEGTLKNGFGAIVDIPGLNYRTYLYNEAHDKFPQGMILGSETASTVSSRGEYMFPVEPSFGKIHPNYQCSSYDMEHCWWSNLPEEDFVLQDDNSWVIGEFVWTGFDYLGEPTPYDEVWPARSSYFGICDLAGLPKDRYYLYRSRWNTTDTTLHILPHWNWAGREGEVTPVFVYTNLPSAELFVNGKSQGRRTKITTGTKQERYRLMWQHVTYEPGTVRVVAYDAEGNAVAEKEICTAGKPYGIRLETDRSKLAATGCDLAYITVSIVDKAGNVCPTAHCQLKFKVKGAGIYRAACNGDATSLEQFHLPTMKTFNGQLVVIVQSLEKAGKLTLEVSGKGLKSRLIEIKTR